MGAGISQKQMDATYRRRLLKLQRELGQDHVSSGNTGLELNGGDSDGQWGIKFRTIRASNGETAGLMTVRIAHKQLTKVFDWTDSTFGIEEVKRLFRKEPHVIPTPIS